MFTITIQKPTGEEAIAELVRVAQFYKDTGILAPAEPTKQAKAPKAAKSESKPAEEPAAPAAETPAPAPAAEAPAPAPAKAPDAEDLRTKIRALLTPVMKTDKAAAARALVKSFGEGIGAVPEDKLAELLAKAEELAK